MEKCMKATSLSARPTPQRSIIYLYRLEAPGTDYEGDDYTATYCRSQ